MTVRKATYDDIPRIMEICSEARSIMRFGWIDSTLKSIDSGKPVQRFTPQFLKDFSRSHSYFIRAGE